MKYSALLLALLTALTPVPLLAQARPEADRDRSPQRPPPEPRPPGAPNPPNPPGERGAEGRSSFSSSSSQNRGMRFDSRGRTSRPVIVTSQPLDAKELAAVEEDLGIMARLLEKEIEREADTGMMVGAMGIALTRLDGRAPSVLLLEGYGAVFTFTVRMLLTAPPLRATEKQPERQPDSPWERTRRELFGPPGGGNRREGDFSGGGGDPFSGRHASPEYDAKKVEELKKSVLEALKQAGHIRALKADDSLTVVVQGGSGGGFGPMETGVEMRTATSSGAGGPPRTETFVNRSSSGDGPRSGALTVRAKKSDAEDFAKGKLTAEQFAKKALVTVR